MTHTVATINSCIQHTGTEPREGEGHLRMSMTWPDSTKPSQPLWCLGYYDQQRQNRRVVVQDGDRREGPVLVGEGLTVVGSRYRVEREPHPVESGGCGECRHPEDFDWDPVRWENGAPVIVCHVHGALAPGWTYDGDVEVGLTAWKNEDVRA